MKMQKMPSKGICCMASTALRLCHKEGGKGLVHVLVLVEGRRGGDSRWIHNISTRTC